MMLICKTALNCDFQNREISLDSIFCLLKNPKKKGQFASSALYEINCFPKIHSNLKSLAQIIMKSKTIILFSSQRNEIF